MADRQKGKEVGINFDSGERIVGLELTKKEDLLRPFLGM